ncbi:MAG TPA: HAMP domain-containing sensor histidine kinase [Bryobacteraceae bacterium]|nr:HAMP domain-containing sensor histidine kinase [Bryobacteraceae bacterium]
MSSNSEACAPAASADLHQMAAAGRLLAGVVHEINTPLGSILSNAEVIERSLEMLAAMLADPRPQSLERARRLVGTCQSLAAIDRVASERIRAVIRGLKKFARADGEAPRAIDLNQHLRDSLLLARAEFGSRIRVEADFGTLPEVECFPQMLGQVFLNLLVNAAHAIEGDGTIRARTRLEDGVVYVAISDTGRGMTAEERARAFQPGFTTKPIGEGCGMGLAIAREIIEDRHGGTIGCESEFGHGATFHIRIPVRRGTRGPEGPAAPGPRSVTP